MNSRFWALAFVLAATGCKAKSDGAAPAASARSAEVRTASLPETDGGFVSAASALESTAIDAGAARRLEDAPLAGKRVDVPAGTFKSGSTPGDEGRDPTLEPLLVPIATTAFAIDALPYPNDPAAPPRTGVSREEASKLCAERGARLCTEIEWERACKGPDGDLFATGPVWNAACEKEPTRCASGFGVRAMGAFREWTDSRFVIADGEGGPVVRGGRGTSARCAARGKPAKGEETTFRCCTGPKNEQVLARPESKPAFRKTKMEPEELAKIFAQVPELARLGQDIRYYTDGDARNMVARSGASHEGVTFATSPILWSPETGAELLVATGRGKSMSFVVALWPLPDGKYRFASSFLMLNDLSPVALAYESRSRKELLWTSCWGCAGEQGSVSYRLDDHRVVIVQH